MGIMMLFFTALMSVADCDSGSNYLTSPIRSPTIILKLDFEKWKNEIDTIPGGFDDYAQRHVYADYVKNIDELAYFLMMRKIAVKVIDTRDSVPVTANRYLVDYKLKCIGGPGERDAWMVTNGFFVRSLKTGCRTDYLGTRSLMKQLKKKVKRKKLTFSQAEY